MGVQTMEEGNKGRVDFHRVHEGVRLKGVHNSPVLKEVGHSISHFVHCTTRRGITPLQRCGREQSTPTLYTVVKNAALCSLWPRGSYYTPTTSLPLSFTCQGSTNKPSRTFPLLVQVLILHTKSEVRNNRGSCTMQITCKSH